MEFVMPSLAFCRTVARHMLMAFFFTIKAVSELEANCELVLSFVLFPTAKAVAELSEEKRSGLRLEIWKFEAHLYVLWTKSSGRVSSAWIFFSVHDPSLPANTPPEKVVEAAVWFCDMNIFLRHG
ncbi:unnamed protein product [Vicia faba]|uniref:Secreted protein n=1 Tax=Vicia faba TaxID=3906 RepID=A0AAV0YUC5_VICFA|nr:unnamed protein product [Vicia faba]